MPKITPDLVIGTHYNDWLLLEEIQGKREKYYLCRCKCGKEKQVTKSNLVNGKSSSCGKGNCKSLSITHGKTDHPLYSVWASIKNRLRHPVGVNECYKDIKLATEWEDFECFYTWAIQAGYTQGLSIDRINRFGNYEPNNCRWVDAIVQSQNRSKWKDKTLPKGVFKSKPRNGEVIYTGTGKAPYYYRFTYKGTSHQAWGFSTPEEAYRAKCAFIEKHYKGLVYSD